jgi:hypothetical protein
MNLNGIGLEVFESSGYADPREDEGTLVDQENEDNENL